MQVKEIVHQDRYRGADHYYELDIALLVLSSSVVTGEHIMPACVDWSATMEPKHNEEGYVSTRLYPTLSASTLSTVPLPSLTSPYEQSIKNPITYNPYICSALTITSSSANYFIFILIVR